MDRSGAIGTRINDVHQKIAIAYSKFRFYKCASEIKQRRKMKTSLQTFQKAGLSQWNSPQSTAQETRSESDLK